MSIRSTISEIEIPLNADLKANYSTFEDGFVFPRPNIGYRNLPDRDWVAPAENEAIAQPIRDGATFELKQHVSIVVAGSATYQFDCPQGPMSYDWTVGMHNVENGGGYLPVGKFTRIFRDGFTLCCFLPTKNADPSAVYSFEIAATLKVLERDALFVHYCAGVRQRQTDFDLTAGTEVSVEANEIAIICYQIEG